VPDRAADRAVSCTERYVPAAGRAWLTALYDPAMALTMRERSFRPALIAAVLADPQPSVVLDVGCGTGTLTAQLAEADPTLHVLGIDGDEAVLALAAQKASRFAGRVRFRTGLAGSLPVGDASADVVIASLLLHHLSPAAKLEALSEARRVLIPSGRLAITDWGQPQDHLTRPGFFLLRLLDGFQNTADHAAGRLPSLLAQTGFSDIRVAQRWRTIWGSLELITAATGKPVLTECALLGLTGCDEPGLVRQRDERRAIAAVELA
jgi:SAM-dependent methyltransferase